MNYIEKNTWKYVQRDYNRYIKDGIDNTIAVVNALDDFWIRNIVQKHNETLRNDYNDDKD